MWNSEENIFERSHKCFIDLEKILKVTNNCMTIASEEAAEPLGKWL